MEEIINAFGIDVRLIIIQLVNFGILLFALVYFLYTPVMRLLDERAEKIKQGIADAERAKQAKDEADQAKQTVLADAHKEAEAIGTRAKTFADEKSDQIVEAAQQKASSVLVDAEKRAEQIKTQAQKESEQEVAKVAILAAEKILKEKNT